MSKLRHQRAYYRLQYPQAERPRIVINGRSYPLVEISEQGAKLLDADDTELKLGQSFIGHVRFHEGADVAVRGVVLRADEELVVRLLPGISYHRMVTEQRRLLSKYPRV